MVRVDENGGLKFVCFHAMSSKIQNPVVGQIAPLSQFSLSY